MIYFFLLHDVLQVLQFLLQLVLFYSVIFVLLVELALLKLVYGLELMLYEGGAGVEFHAGLPQALVLELLLEEKHLQVLDLLDVLSKQDVFWVFV